VEFDFDKDSPQGLRFFEFRYKGETYTCQEASERAAANYRGRAMECLIPPREEGGQPTMTSKMAHVQAMLVAECTTRNVTGKNAVVTEEEVNDWPARVVKVVFDRLKEISDLNEADTVEALEKSRERVEAKLKKLKAQNDPK
jgi:hypothetical protein